MLTVFFGFMTEKLRKVRQPREMVQLVLINQNRVERCDRRLPNDRRNEPFHIARGCSEGLPPEPIYNKDG